MSQLASLAPEAEQTELPFVFISRLDDAVARQRLDDLRRRIDNLFALVDGRREDFRSLIGIINAGHQRFQASLAARYGREVTRPECLEPLLVDDFDGSTVKLYTASGDSFTIAPTGC